MGALTQQLSETGEGAASASQLALTGVGQEGGGAVVLPMKLGSLQEFVWHDCDTSELGPSRFSAADVHRIGILDIRLFNTDRHGGNMLVRKCCWHGNAGWG
jgi:hypothetical protein